MKRTSLATFVVLSMMSSTVYGADLTVVTSPVENTVVTETGITANAQGQSATLVVGKAGMPLGEPEVKNGAGTLQKVAATSFMTSAVGTAAQATGGNLTFHSGSVVEAYGGLAVHTAGGAATANGSQVTVNNGDIDQSEFTGLHGGMAQSMIFAPGAEKAKLSAISNDNKVTITGGMIDAYVAGGTGYGETHAESASIYTEANQNTVTITGGDVAATENGILGGYSYALSNQGKETVTSKGNDNTVTVDLEGYRGRIRGAYTTATTYDGVAEAHADGNTVVVKNVKSAEISGGESSAMNNGFDAVDPDAVNKASASNNTVTVENGKSTSLWGSYAFADRGNASTGSVEGRANGNKVTVTNGIITSGAYYGTNAGVALVTQNAPEGYALGEANDNVYVAKDSTIDNVLRGGFTTASSYTEGKMVTTQANRNRVEIMGGEVKSVEGAKGAADSYDGGLGTSSVVKGEASHNTVSIKKATVGNVMGGYASASSSDKAEAVASHNSIELDGVVLKENSYVVGGALYTEGPNGMTSEGSHNTVTVIGDLDAPTVTMRGAAMLTGRQALTDDDPTAAMDNTLTLKGDMVKLDSIGRFQTLNLAPMKMETGKAILELHSGEETRLSNMAVNVAIPTNTTVQEGMELVKANSAMIEAEDTKVTVMQGASALYKARLSEDKKVLGFFKDLEATLHPQTKVLAEAALAPHAFLMSDHSYVPIKGDAVTFKGTHHNKTFSTGSSVKIKGSTYDLEVGKEGMSRKYAFFGEYGKGDYTAKLDMPVWGTGDVDYLGVGVKAEQQVKPNVTVYGAVKVGKTKTTFQSDSFTTLAGPVKESFTVKAPYYGVRVGAMKTYDLEQQRTFTLRGDYSLLHSSGRHATLSTGEDYRFHGVTSHRLEVEGKYTQALNRTTKVFGAAGLSYVFGNHSTASYHGLSTLEPSLNGLSLHVNAGAWKRFSPAWEGKVEVGGFFGKERGTQYGAEVTYRF